MSCAEPLRGLLDGALLFDRKRLEFGLQFRCRLKVEETAYLSWVVEKGRHGLQFLVTRLFWWLNLDFLAAIR